MPIRPASPFRPSLPSALGGDTGRFKGSTGQNRANNATGATGLTSRFTVGQDPSMTVGETPSQRVARDLRTRIDAGEWAPGDRLPSVGQLSAHYGVARATIVKAVRQLVAEKL